jgi:N-acetylglucosamine-6-sulfatase
VFVLLDDVRSDDLYDHPLLELPTIRQLAAEGARFDNFFTVAPLCSPSRAAFLTGQYPFRNGIVDNRERAVESHQIRTFPRMLQDTGYRTAFIGKWHMGHEDAGPRPGFDHWVSFVGQGTYFDPEMNINGRTALEAGYITDVLTRYAVEFIDGADRDRPLVLFLAHKAVHPEIHPGRIRSFPSAPEDEGLVDAGELPRSPSWRASLEGKQALARITEYEDPRSPEGGTPDEAIRGRLRMLLSVDRGLNWTTRCWCSRATRGSSTVSSAWPRSGGSRTSPASESP